MAYSYGKRRVGMRKSSGFGKRKAKFGQSPFSPKPNRGMVKRYLSHGVSSAARVAGTVAGLVKSVSFLKGVINSEKKHIEQKIYSEGQGVGQTFGSLDQGYIITDITPPIQQGTAANQRTGDSVKLHSLRLRMLFSQMKNLQTKSKYVIELFLVKGSPIDMGTPVQTMNRFYEPNPITGYTDYLAVRNPDFYNEFRLIARRKVKIDVDAFSSQNAVNQTDVLMNVPLSHHLRWDQNSEEIANGQLVMLIRADTGNASPSTTGTATPGVTNILPLSGANVTLYNQWYYYDN